MECAEGLVQLEGIEVHAGYELASGVSAYFDSIASDGKSSGFGLQIIGTDGIIQVQCDCEPLVYFIPGNPFVAGRDPRPWIPVGAAGPGVEASEDERREVTQIQEHIIPARDLIAACASDREPLCGLDEAATTVEMVCAVFESHRQEGRAVTFPLAERGNALKKLV